MYTGCHSAPVVHVVRFSLILRCSLLFTVFYLFLYVYPVTGLPTTRKCNVSTMNCIYCTVRTPHALCPKASPYSPLTGTLRPSSFLTVDPSASTSTSAAQQQPAAEAAADMALDPFASYFSSTDDPSTYHDIAQGDTYDVQVLR